MIILTTIKPNVSRNLLVQGSNFLGDTFYETHAKVTKFANEHIKLGVVILFDKNDTDTHAYRAFKRYAHVEINP